MIYIYRIGSEKTGSTRRRGKKMKTKYEPGIDMNKHKFQINNIFIVALMLLVLALIIMPGASANSGYFGALQSVYGTTGTSCSTCHTSPPALNSYGNAFAAITSHSSNPTGALVSIGVPPGVPSPRDTIAPETNISGVIENGLYNNNVIITFTVADNTGGSGVKETIFSVNGGQTTTYTVPFVVDTIGQDNVTYWSTDNAGNIEIQKMVNFTIINESLDTIPPETNISGVTENGLYNNNVLIILTASDNTEGSGIKETMFRVNGGQTTTYTMPFIVDAIGQDNVTYWSADNAGNIESPKMVNFSIISVLGTDNIPPITNIWGVAENGSYNNVTISFTATDNPGGSGINETVFIINGGQTTTYTVPFVVDKTGQDNVTYWSTDNAGNIESPKMVNFTFVPSINATRKIESISILPGESTNITISITSSVNQALNLHEIIPEEWNVTFTSDDLNGFKNSTNEWILFEILPGVTRNITYTLTSPGNVSIGTYQINGTISNDGIVENVSGNESVKIDILEFYRRLGNDPAIIETGDMMEAINDSRNGIIPSGFDRPLNAQEIGELVNEWINT